MVYIYIYIYLFRNAWIFTLMICEWCVSCDVSTYMDDNVFRSVYILLIFNTDLSILFTLYILDSREFGAIDFL